MIKELFWKIVSALAPAGEPAPVILMYHSIGNNKAQFTVKPEAFEKQMSFLRSSGRECLKLSEFASRLKSGTLPKNAVAVTFDDGYVDNYDLALIILKKYSIPATILISTGYIGKNFTTSNGILIRIMDEENIRELLKEDLIECMSHSHSHGILRDMKREDVVKDVKASQNVICNLTGKHPTGFAYPYGKYSDDTVDIVRSLGFQSAVTVEEGIVAPHTDPLRLPRMAISATTSMAEFKCKVAKPRSYLAIKGLVRRKK